MEREGIIRPCPEPTEWVHNLVVVVKKDGLLRLCLDPRSLNKYLVRSVHDMASWEDVQHSFQDGLYFSTLDAKSGYWTKRLSKQSQLLTSFNTPLKKYSFLVQVKSCVTAYFFFFKRGVLTTIGLTTCHNGFVETASSVYGSCE